jgi:hypothetical protein
MATLVMLAGILLFLQRAWSSFLERLWKSITQNSQNNNNKTRKNLRNCSLEMFKTRCFGLWKIWLQRKKERVEAMREGGNGWRGICKRDVGETLGNVTVGAWNLNFEFGLGLD